MPLWSHKSTPVVSHQHPCGLRIVPLWSHTVLLWSEVSNQYLYHCGLTLEPLCLQIIALVVLQRHHCSSQIYMSESLRSPSVDLQSHMHIGTPKVHLSSELSIVVTLVGPRDK